MIIAKFRLITFIGTVLLIRHDVSNLMNTGDLTSILVFYDNVVSLDKYSRGVVGRHEPLGIDIVAPC